MSARKPAARLIERGIERGSWSESALSGFVPAGAPDGAATLERLWTQVLGGSAARVRLFGDAERTRRALPAEPLPSHVVVDRYLPPGASGSGDLGVSATVVRVREGSTLCVSSLGGGARGWRLDSGAWSMGCVARVASPALDPVTAYEDSIEGLFDGLAGLGFAPGDLARTWYFFADVLAEYDRFNDARRRIYARHGIPPALLPASTGIQGIVDSGQHVVVDGIAFAGAGVRCSVVANPAQSEAPSYGSLFSRAVRVDADGVVRLYVSGMAAIGLRGETLHVGDPLAQLEDTLARAGRLLAAAGLDWPDVVEGIAYLHPAYYPELREKIEGSMLRDLPFAVAPAHVCRGDLLFEIEFSAARPSGGSIVQHRGPWYRLSR